jgi:hypothetical protein
VTAAERLGWEIGELYRQQAPLLFEDLLESGKLACGSTPEALERARLEWECFALYACVRGIVAGADFGGPTSAAIDAFHEAAVPEPPGDAGRLAVAELRRRASERYDEYADIGKAGGASGAVTVTLRLGAAAARHMLGTEPTLELAELVGELHESLAEVVADAVRRTRAGAGPSPPKTEER